MTTHIYHDVDGVYNCLPTASTPWQWGWTPGSMVSERINGHTITWSEDMVRQMNELTSYPGVRSFWLTTWRDDARTKIAPELGITGAESWEVLHPLEDEDMFDSRIRWWKLRAIMQHVYATQPDRVLWLDDDLAIEEDARRWVDGRDWVLGIAPRIELALTRDHLERASEWLRGE